jgi:hypothetical protein
MFIQTNARLHPVVFVNIPVYTGPTSVHSDNYVYWHAGSALESSVLASLSFNERDVGGTCVPDQSVRNDRDHM